MRKAGTVRITGQLIDAVTGGHLWAERYDRDVSDIFMVQDDIARASPGSSSLHRPPPSNDARRASCRNGSMPGSLSAGPWRFYIYRPDENKTALAFFRQVIVLDPTFASAITDMHWPSKGISGTSRHRSFFGGSGAREEAQIAVLLTTEDAMAHAVLVHMMMWGSEWEVVIAEARTGLALNRTAPLSSACWLWTPGLAVIERKRSAERAAGNACQPTRSSDLALVALARGLAVFFTRFRRCAADVAPSCSPAPGLWLPLRIYRRVARLSRQLDEAREALERIPPQSLEQLQRWQQRPPWMRPEDYALRVEGVRLAAGERRRRDPNQL